MTPERRFCRLTCEDCGNFIIVSVAEAPKVVLAWECSACGAKFPPKVKILPAQE